MPGSIAPAGLRIEIISLPDNGWLGGAVTNPDGSFLIKLNRSLTIDSQVVYNVYKGTVLIKTLQTGAAATSVQISLTDKEYDSVVPDDSQEEHPVNYVVFRGRVTLGKSYVVAIPNSTDIVVYVRKALFRTDKILGSTAIDTFGNYEIKIPYRLLFPAYDSPVAMQNVVFNAKQNALSNVFLDIRNGDTVLDHSAPMSVGDTHVSHDFHIENASHFIWFTREYNHISQAIQTITGLNSSQFHTITDSGDNPESTTVSSLAGQAPGMIANMIAAAKIRQSTSMTFEHAYALQRVLPDGIRTWGGYDDSVLTDILSNAVTDHIVPNTGSVPTTIEVIRNKYCDFVAADQAPDDASIHELINAIFNHEGKTNTFLSLSLQYKDIQPVDVFWDTVQEMMSPEDKVLAQRGMQVLGITGMQVEMTRSVLNILETEGKPLYALAVEDDAYWYPIIGNVCTSENKLCVPLSIRGEHTEPNNPEIWTDYARQLSTIFQDTFATYVIGDRISKDQVSPEVIANPEKATEEFIANHPEYDLRFQNIWDFDIDTIEHGEAIRNDLMKIQNLLRITDGAPDAVVEMLNAQIVSSADIADMDQQAFVTAFSELLRGPAAAQQVYMQAVRTNMLTANIHATIQPNHYPAFTPFTPVDWPGWLSAPQPSNIPDLETLFGNSDLCSCQECTSMYSPAAYFTDVMRFLQVKISSPYPNLSAYVELVRRRPDLPRIDLTCKNTNTPVPYVDLVNELLELLILKNKGVSVPFISYQTTGSALELQAYPEHTYRDSSNNYISYDGFESVYNTHLKEGVYPNLLPFVLPVEETRTYMEHLGYKRYDMMRHFRVNTNYTTDTTATVNEYNTLIEWLKISREEANAIASTATGTADVRKYYGFSTGENTWYDTLTDGYPGEGLHTLLYRANISYQDLLELLICDFLNKHQVIGGTLMRLFEIVSTNINNPASCVLKELKLRCNHLTPVPTKIAFFNHLYRMIRLKKATGWSFYQLDMVLNAYAATAINVEVLKYVCSVHYYATQYGVPPENLCGFWNSLSTVKYINFNSDNQDVQPSVYERLFQNKAVTNPPDAAFQNPASFSISYQTGLSTIVSVTNISMDELTALLSHMAITPSTTIQLTLLSKVYATVLMIRGLGVSVNEFIRISLLNNISFTGTVSALFTRMKTLHEAVRTFREFTFSLDDTEYLIAHKDPSGNYQPTSATIQVFYETLREEMKKQLGAADPSSDPDMESALKNIVLTAFTEHFSTERSMTKYMLENMFKGNSGGGSMFLIEALTRMAFINSTNEVNETNYYSLFLVFLSMQKAVFVALRYRIGKEELEIFHVRGNTTPGTANPLDVLNFSTFPYTSPSLPAASILLQEFIRLDNWIKVKGRLNLRAEEFIKVLRESSTLSASGSGTSSKTTWRNLIAQLTGWSSEDLLVLLGSNNTVLPTTNILAAAFTIATVNNMYRFGTLLLQVADIFSATKRVGLSPLLVSQSLSTDVTMAHSRNIRMAAKSKHEDASWAKVAKPLQDTLREKQRKALVAYIVKHGSIISGNLLPIRNENELYAYLLIDVEMQPCMMTSRIKQAISTVQLFVDRLILNLEKVNDMAGQLISIQPDHTKQWRSWRKWYRIWEANRKIFLYPENWIEPELRDNKTPLFKELETQLLQDEPKEDTVEAAYLQYLEGLDEVARLEPVGSYHEIDYSEGRSVDRVHVFGRTASQPHRYYYRFLENNEWSAWEKINVDIKSDHITPVVWNGRLYLFWLTFKKKQPTEEELELMRGSNKNSFVSFLSSILKREPNSYRIFLGQLKTVMYNTLEVTLNWAEYYASSHKWITNNYAKDIMHIPLYNMRVNESENPNLSSGSHKTAQDMYMWLTHREEISFDDFFINRLFLLPSSADKHINQNEGIDFSLIFSHGFDEIGYSIHQFIWRGDNSQDPVVLRDGHLGYQVMAPKDTAFNKMKFVRTDLLNRRIQIGSTGLKWDNTEYTPGTTVDRSYFSYSHGDMVTERCIKRNTWNSLLDKTPYVSYEITARSSRENIPNLRFQNPLSHMFHYADKQNTYFVREEIYYAKSINGLMNNGPLSSFSSAQLFSENSYPYSGIGGLNTPTNTLSSNTMSSSYGSVKHRFYTFYHAQIKDYIRKLYAGGIPEVLNIGNQKQDDTMNFLQMYQPTPLIHPEYPRNNVQFDLADAYSMYNWEIFFHIPMFIAQRLSQNQQFEEAQKWYHYIFNPTSNTDIDGQYSADVNRFWKFYPFYEEASHPMATLTDLLAAIHSGVPEAVAQVTLWEKHPFNPHIIARVRILAYMKNVFMKYLDNLIAWGDQLFRRDTIESINEATQLYILAANLLGQRPSEIPPRAQAGAKSYQDLDIAGLNALSNAMVSIESYFTPNAPIVVNNISSLNVLSPLRPPLKPPFYGKMFYFCLPKNDKLFGYWDTIADRLFKIRNCMNIEGIVRQLPLFEPPIDPAMLVKATAMGVDINSILDNVSGSNTPNYRFSFMLQKANEVCADVRALGSGLLAALEKKDAEQLALLRSGHELALLEKIRYIREQQVAEAEAALEAAQLSKENTQQRFTYYSSRPYMNAGEQQHLQSLQTGMSLQENQSQLQASASGASGAPQFHGQATFAVGASFGGQQIAAGLQAMSAVAGIAVMVNNTKGTMTATRAGYDRRRDDWNFQAQSAEKELEQAEQQVIAARIRLDIARKELANQETQIENTQETDAFMRGKYTNRELYNWMISQVAATYFQSYQLAYDLAKKTELSYLYELPLASEPVGGFIKFGYWDSLKKGLLSGERLQFDLRKMEAAYLEDNKRELELTKHFSLALINPQALLDLVTGGICDFKLDEVWYDLDYPGHYMRKIKSVSISIPCVTGPYTTIAASLTLQSSEIQKMASQAIAPAPAPVIRSMATSSAQNDAGMFELNFRDERYMPFENAGAVSTWNLKMMETIGLRQFDYSMITDVIVHIHYTARQDGSKEMNTVDALKQKLGVASGTRLELPRYFSLKHEFSQAWYAGFDQLVNVPSVGNVGRPMNLKILRSQFPEYAQGKTIGIFKASFLLQPKALTSGAVYFLRFGSTTITLSTTSLVLINPLALTLAPGDAEKDLNFIVYKTVSGVGQPIAEAEWQDLLFVCTYKLNP